MRNLDDRPNTTYPERRKVVSDSYLADSNTVQDLAHLVAIQLLGACFTLPPNYFPGMSPSNYVDLETGSSSLIPNPQMISSLRLHTHFRYSPCFGHQPRNSSPVSSWPSIFDGSMSKEPTVIDSGDSVESDLKQQVCDGSFLIAAP